ncbi:MAG TPA: phosphotransferase [Acidimicrobiales bacterium]|nr:phosphotransferase [Acidimicrobiales bacterium]
MNFSPAVAAARHFRMAGDVATVQPLGAGHIHDSFLVTAGPETGPVRYVLQRVNSAVLPDPATVAETVARVAAHQHRVLARAGCADAHRRALTVVEADDGRPFHLDAEGRHWRAFLHIGGARSHRRVESPALAAEVARVAARFLVEVAELPGRPPPEAIPGFRDFRARQAMLEEVAAADARGRRAECGAELDALRSLGFLVDELERAREAGLLPERVVHNDAKADNVLVDEVTGEGLCMVDLDTVASGTVLFDVGDLVRSATTTVAEDDADAPTVVRRDHLQAVVSAYLTTAGPLLGPGERALLPLAGPLMTYEAALRFLADHLAGDAYFRVARPGQNLDRARAQLRLLHALVDAREATAELVAGASAE